MPEITFQLFTPIATRSSVTSALRESGDAGSQNWTEILREMTTVR